MVQHIRRMANLPATESMLKPAGKTWWPAQKETHGLHPVGFWGEKQTISRWFCGPGLNDIGPTKPTRQGFMSRRSKDKGKILATLYFSPLQEFAPCSL
jgi:hypothetical protein